jgi:hypothetical protein
MNKGTSTWEKAQDPGESSPSQADFWASAFSHSNRVSPPIPPVLTQTTKRMCGIGKSFKELSRS